jgi:hypothetical protein
MGHRIVKQPNGLFAVWSTKADGFLYVNCTKEELIKGLLEDSIEITRRSTEQWVEKELKNEKKLKSEYEEAMAFLKEVKYDEYLEILKDIKGG